MELQKPVEELFQELKQDVIKVWTRGKNSLERKEPIQTTLERQLI